MGLLDLLPSSNLGNQGQTPDIRQGALNTSTLHNQSSINNTPVIESQPSDLDLNGNTPSKYTDNLPG